jgi:hypothetical protein
MTEIFREIGTNWDWFAVIEVNEENSTVYVHRYYRKHREVALTEEEKSSRPAISCFSPVMEESPKRIALRYNHPDYGWLEIANQKNIFDYR